MTKEEVEKIQPGDLLVVTAKWGTIERFRIVIAVDVEKAFIKTENILSVKGLVLKSNISNEICKSYYFDSPPYTIVSLEKFFHQ